MSEKDPLTSRLAEWRVQPAIDPAFRQSVWKRIDATGGRQASRQSPGISFGLAALASVSLLIAAGLGGRAQAHAMAKQEREALALHYLAGLDARGKLEAGQ